LSKASKSEPEDFGEPTEVEVKLGVSLPRRISALLRNPDPAVLAGFRPVGPLTRRTIVDRYIDTDQEGGRLASASMRARLRHHARRVTLTVKRSGVQTEGVTERMEVEAPATRTLDPERWPPSDARSVLLARVGSSKLGEVARLRQRRIVRIVERGPTRVELSLDRVDAMVRDRVVDRRYELEAELLAGDREDLAELAEALGRLDGVSPAAGSKLGFALAARASAKGFEEPER
jgi:inorganic triphosphatase YgiF